MAAIPNPSTVSQTAMLGSVVKKIRTAKSVQEALEKYTREHPHKQAKKQRNPG